MPAAFSALHLAVMMKKDKTLKLLLKQAPIDSLPVSSCCVMSLMVHVCDAGLLAPTSANSKWMGEKQHWNGGVSQILMAYCTLDSAIPLLKSYE